jgi:phosphopantetheinyl transferase (holo-ACP synthase)
VIPLPSEILQPIHFHSVAPLSPSFGKLIYYLFYFIRWALKEAAYKALAVGRVAFTDIVIEEKIVKPLPLVLQGNAGAYFHHFSEPFKT